jgi:hypothetical protein
MFDEATDLRPALLQGEYTKAVACAEYAGVPVDAPLYRLMKRHWRDLQASVIDRVNATIPVFEGGKFKMVRFDAWLKSLGLHEDWPTTARQTAPETGEEPASQPKPLARNKRLEPSLSALLLQAIHLAGTRRGRLSKAELREQTLLEVLMAAMRRAR